MGTPPLTRGKGLKAYQERMAKRNTPAHAGKGFGGGRKDLQTRNTPAHAGKSSIILSCQFSIREHPRSRGEKYAAIILDLTERRNTPAHAGKSGLFGGLFDSSQEHPRSRGEKSSSHMKSGLL